MVLVSFSAKCNFLVLQLMGTRNFVRWIFVACQQVILAILQRILTGFFFKCYLYYPKRAPRCSVSCFFPRNASWDIVYLSLKRGLVLEWFAPSNSWHIISQMSLDMYIYIYKMKLAGTSFEIVPCSMFEPNLPSNVWNSTDHFVQSYHLSKV